MFHKYKVVAYGHFHLQRKFYVGGKLPQPFWMKIQVSIYAHKPPFLLASATQNLGSKVSLVTHKVSSQGMGIGDLNVSILPCQEYLLLVVEGYVRAGRGDHRVSILSLQIHPTLQRIFNREIYILYTYTMKWCLPDHITHDIKWYRHTQPCRLGEFFYFQLQVLEQTFQGRSFLRSDRNSRVPLWWSSLPFAVDLSICSLSG